MVNKKSKYLVGTPTSNWEGGNPLLTKPKARSNAPKQPGRVSGRKAKMRVVGRGGRG